ncbi:SgcJ/EcaC family oxidoreductase [Streptomyces smyrnaeus]|uniref:YybH family protein n=1 Tax=Streptomyces smyrnaeus TaxID=1387713 RepID=UPI0033AC9295
MHSQNSTTGTTGTNVSTGTTDPAPLPVARQAADVPAVFAARFNTGQPRAVAEMYEPEAVFVSPDGTVADSPEAIARANADILALGLPITVRPRHVHVAGDTALLVVDWEIAGTASDGRPTHLTGTATDVARRGSDGTWRYVIDRPAG